MWTQPSENILLNLENVLAIKSKICITGADEHYWLEFSGRGEYVGECVFYKKKEDRDRDFNRLRAHLTQSES